MAKFNDGTHSLDKSFKNPNNMLCPQCGEYGLTSLHVFVYGAETSWEVCMRVVCLECSHQARLRSATGKAYTQEKQGRFITLYTGRPSRPDITCREANLPPGYCLDDIRRAVEARPLQEGFSLSELAQYRQEQNFAF